MIKRKKLNDVYMKEVTNSIIKTEFNEELNAYITYKHVVETSAPATAYVNGKKRIVLDKDYTIIEYSPVSEKYNCRVCIDNKDNILQYYFDVIEGIELVDNELYYNDLFLDVVYHQKPLAGENYITLLDENELVDALKKGEIDKETYDYCYKVADKIMDELVNNKNKFVNRGLKDFYKMKEE